MPTPAPSTVSTDPSWFDIAGFIVSVVGTAASTAIAIIAIVLTVTTARASQRREERAKREQWVSDYNVWLDAGVVYMLTGMDTAVQDKEWVSRGRDLSARASVLESPGANDHLVAARSARGLLAVLPVETRVDIVLDITRLLKLWASKWAHEPTTRPGDVGEWITAYTKRDADGATEAGDTAEKP